MSNRDLLLAFHLWPFHVFLLKLFSIGSMQRNGNVDRMRKTVGLEWRNRYWVLCCFYKLTINFLCLLRTCVLSENSDPQVNSQGGVCHLFPAALPSYLLER